MAKKAKNEAPNPNSVTNRDILQRLNFLYQASTYLNSLQAGPSRTPQSKAPVDRSTDAVHDIASPGTTASSKKDKRREQNRRRHPTTYTDLSRSYVQSMKTIGTKTNVRMDPSVKRTLCKGCNIVLVPGSTAAVRIKSSSAHGHVMTYSCLLCNHVRRIPAPPVLLEEGEGDDTNIPAAQPEASTEAGHTSGGDEEDTVMDVDSNVSALGGTVSHRRRRRPKRGPIPKPLPLFQRKGHVVFRGNEKLPDDS